jgi:hypothetical protein
MNTPIHPSTHPKYQKVIFTMAFCLNGKAMVMGLLFDQGTFQF